MWAHDRSLDPHAPGAHNLLGLQSAALGWVSMTISMALNLALALLVGSMLADGLRRRRAVA